MLDSSILDVIVMSDLRLRLGITHGCQTQANNKQRDDNSVVRRQKRKKDLKQLIIGSNPTMICLHASFHVEEGTTVHLVIRRMGRFSHREVFYVPP